MSIRHHFAEFVLPSERFCLIPHIYLSLPTLATVFPMLYNSDTCTIPCSPNPSLRYLCAYDITLPSSFSLTAFHTSICHSPRPLDSVFTMFHSTRTRARYHDHLARPRIPIPIRHHFAEFVLSSERFCLVGTHTYCILSTYLSPHARKLLYSRCFIVR